MTASIPTEHAIEQLSTQDGYDRWSETYDVDENPLVAIEGPWIKRLLGDIQGLSVPTPSGDISSLQSQLTTIQSDATALVNSAKSDFPSETSAIKSSVDTMSSAVKALPSSPSTSQIAAIVSSDPSLSSDATMMEFLEFTLATSAVWTPTRDSMDLGSLRSATTVAFYASLFRLIWSDLGFSARAVS